MIDPIELGIPRCDPAELRGGSPAENAPAIREVFAGADGGRRDAIMLNAAGAIAASGHAEDLREGSSSRARRSTPAPRPSGSTSWRVSRCGLATRSPAPGSARSPRSSGARRRSATSVRMPTRPARRRLRARRRRGRLGARGRALRRRLGRPAGGARGVGDAAAREGLLLDGGAPAHGEGGRCGRRAAATPRPRRRSDADAARRSPTSSASTRSSKRTTPTSWSVRSCSGRP